MATSSIAPQSLAGPVRRLVGPVARRLSFWLEWIPEGVRVPGAYLPPPGLDATPDGVCAGRTPMRRKKFLPIDIAPSPLRRLPLAPTFFCHVLLLIGGSVAAGRFGAYVP
jgi:hypothetical protein